jgi:DUF971 family protein
MADAVAAPTEIRVSRDRKLLTLRFGSDETIELEAELLRVYSPSAEVQGHSPEQKVLVHGKRNVGIMKIEPVGNYAIRIEFDDLHNTGIFSWRFLKEMGTLKERKWRDYEAELNAAGKGR